MELCPAQKFQYVKKPIFHLKTKLSNIYMYCSFCIVLLTTFKGHMPFSQRCDTPNHDFVRLCDRIFHTIGTSSPWRHLTLWCVLSSSLFVLCFIREAHLCRWDLCCCCCYCFVVSTGCRHNRKYHQFFMVIWHKAHEHSSST